MYSSTALISEELFRKHSPVTGNTNITEFIPYLAIAQELYIAPVLGEALMTELKLQIDNNNLTEINSLLILKIAPALSFFAVYQGLPFHWAAIVNKGITIRESENSKSIDINDVAQLRQWIRNDANIFVELLTDFLCSQQKAYPLWKPDKNYCSECNSTQVFNSGFYFPEK
ncbi:hypothetical protein D0T53_09240 [Dysgonomonas sp. 216]|uniref:DUF6712 family protein n=1 Tax=Dysgonomonas sp. 216 TaxID=2302934 RepID=UPI0013D6F656|nr:DUF6712 family protein [Dysgonomonas sp. 216]NDW19096.1 hypothetical protein [Dysgonomonas sp. 216]